MKILCDYKNLYDKKPTTCLNTLQGQSRPKKTAQYANNLFKNEAINDKFTAQNIAFKSFSEMMPMYLRLKKEAKPILARSIVFGPSEYKSLTNAELEVLRNFGELIKYSRINRFILDFGEFFSMQIHKKYPKGFVLVSVGRSPEFLGKYLEFQGKDVKYCPISGFSFYDKRHCSAYFIKKYKEYLDTIGLTKEFVENSQKPIIITDHSNTGNTLARFEDFLTSPDIGIPKGEKVIYSPIVYNGFFERGNGIFDHPWSNLHYENVDYDIGEEYGDIMSLSMHEDLASIPELYPFYNNKLVDKIFDKFYSNGNQFEENFDTKMTHFLIADKVLSKT